MRAARLERGMTLAQLGEPHLSRSFLSQVELGHARLSLRSLVLVADRLGLPIAYFLDDSPTGGHDPYANARERAHAALAHSMRLREQGELDEAIRFAFRAAQMALNAESTSAADHN
jgi:transcriptional regulator with XRE-family HTH domain